MMLVKFSRIALLMVSVFVFSVYLPQFFWKIFYKPKTYYFTMFSPVIDNFVIQKVTLEGAEYYDAVGSDLTRRDFDRLLPLLSARQLMFEGRFPDSLRGIKLNPEEIGINNIRLMIVPYNQDNDEIRVYPLFESQSGRVRLELPDDYFRITDKMEFIHAPSNTVNKELSELFTGELVSQNFAFPAKLIAGNPTTRKPFDEGYFLVDAGNKMFHCKMVQSKPFLARVPIPDSIHVGYIYVSEMNLKEFYGLIITTDNHCYLISYDNYRLIEMPVPPYDRSHDRMRVYGDLFFRNINVYSDTAVASLATDRNYRILDTFQETWEGQYESSAGWFNEFLFPFSIHLKSEDSGFIGFFIHPPSLRSVWGILVFSTLFLFLLALRKKSLKNNWIDFLLVLTCGIYGLMAVLVIKPLNNISR
jgi:hypothetical protein